MAEDRTGSAGTKVLIRTMTSGAITEARVRHQQQVMMTRRAGILPHLIFFWTKSDDHDCFIEFLPSSQVCSQDELNKKENKLLLVQ